jgi:hypothetical protein
MGAKRKFKDDRKASILHIDKCPPCHGQEPEKLPVTGDLRLAGTGKA